MAHLTDSELVVLKARALAAQVSSSHLAHAESHIMALVDEVLTLRGGKKVAIKDMVKPATVAVLDEVKAAGVEVKTAVSIEALADQLSKDLSGEKDAHDLAVDKVEAEVKASKGSKKGK
jgi:uncharacterized Fe-S cluster-containing radical SAM superfamily enzyme